MLVNCHECGKSVSTEAANCPSCGAPVRQPPPRLPVSSNPFKRHIGPIILGVVALVVIAAAAISDNKGEAQREAQAQHEAAACRANLSCWGHKNLPRADAYCKAHIERLALHSVKWTDSFGEPLFSRYAWLDEKAGSLTYIGDKAEFQNGFGAFTPVSYACDLGALDKDTPQVLDVRVTEGHLPP